MKTYLDPQPYAVERLNKLQSNPHELAHHNQEKIPKSLNSISDKEIFLHESEEQAWRDVLEKNRY